MIQKLLLSIFSYLIVGNCLACSCAYSEEFNLLDYDSYKYIFEVKIESKYEFKKDTTERNKPKPPSLYEYDLLDGYNISMIEVFKGDLKLSEKIMGFPKNSSCSWTPEIGVTYIFYANSLNNIESCNRILIKKYEKENYLNEKSILNTLKYSPSEVLIQIEKNTIIEGSHINSKREGTWKVYSPKNNELALSLIYDKGELISISKETGYKQEDEWLRITYSYYSKSIK
jgi:hypothetical protein